MVAVGSAVGQPTISDLLNKIATLEKKIGGGTRAFTGICHKCHQHGHMARNCPNSGVAAAAIGRADGLGIPMNF